MFVCLFCFVGHCLCPVTFLVVCEEKSILNCCSVSFKSGKEKKKKNRVRKIVCPKEGSDGLYSFTPYFNHCKGCVIAITIQSKENPRSKHKPVHCVLWAVVFSSAPPHVILCKGTSHVLRTGTRNGNRWQAFLEAGSTPVRTYFL